MNSTLILDADDTLWENNVYFEEAIDRFLDLLSSRRFSRAASRERLMETERRNIHVHGYGTTSFRHSLLETLEALTGAPASPADLGIIDELTHTIANMPIDLLPDVEPTLRRLRDRFRLILFSKGDLLEQKRKVDRSGLADYFDGVELTAEKDRWAYTRLVQSHRLDPATTWMVGNSPRSDINPALEAGLRAILIPHPRTWELEHETVPENGDGRFHRLERFADLLELFGIRPDDVRAYTVPSDRSP